MIVYILLLKKQFSVHFNYKINVYCSVIMFKMFIIIACLLFMAGCQPPTKYTTHEEYVEKYKGDRKKGLVKDCHASWSIHWKHDI